MARGKKKENGNGKVLATQQSVNQAVKGICDIMRRSNCQGAMQYVPELSWMLFLRILDDHETRECEEMEALGLEFIPSLVAPYRWQDWAAPYDETITVYQDGGRKQGWKRKEKHADGSSGDFFRFVNNELLPYMRGIENIPGASPRQKVISEIMSSVERIRIDTERNFCEILDKVHGISVESVDDTHVFTISQVFEGLLLKMGEKGNDGGQFFTPREVIRAMVRAIDPQVGETVYDPGCGTGGFLAQSYEYMRTALGAEATAEQIDTLKHATFFGREKDDVVYPIALANLVLHGIDQPNLWHGNTLTNEKVYDGLFVTAPAQFDVILTNPPFGGKEGKAAQTNFAYKTSATQVLFLQHVIDHLKEGGRCGIVMDEGVLFRTNETAFVQTKRKLLEENNLWCILSLPGGVFTAAGAGVKTNLLFFKKGEHTEKIWYYDLSGIKVGKKTPMTLDKFEDFFRLLPTRGDSEQSWTIDMVARKQKAREAAEPFKQQARKKEQETAQWFEKAKELKKTNPTDDKALARALQKATELGKEAREQLAKAEEIENAVYDLKAVNPNAKAEEGKRTPEQLLDFIEAKGREIAAALAVLRR
ncbi:MAG: N-6 DNA methylase [Salinivirgaceae bacterium]|nr:N-6 DNA methylase [Salinivirgaceae bacterium]